MNFHGKQGFPILAANPTPPQYFLRGEMWLEWPGSGRARSLATPATSLLFFLGGRQAEILKISGILKIGGKYIDFHA